MPRRRRGRTAGAVPGILQPALGFGGGLHGPPGAEPQFEGKSVEQLAQEQGKGIMEAFWTCPWTKTWRPTSCALTANVDVDSQRQILGSPYTVIGTTDGGARPDTMATATNTAPICWATGYGNSRLCRWKMPSIG